MHRRPRRRPQLRLSSRASRSLNNGERLTTFVRLACLLISAWVLLGCQHVNLPALPRVGVPKFDLPGVDLPKLRWPFGRKSESDSAAGADAADVTATPVEGTLPGASKDRAQRQAELRACRGDTRPLLRVEAASRWRLPLDAPLAVGVQADAGGDATVRAAVAGFRRVFRRAMPVAYTASVERLRSRFDYAVLVGVPSPLPAAEQPPARTLKRLKTLLPSRRRESHMSVRLVDVRTNVTLEAAEVVSRATYPHCHNDRVEATLEAYARGLAGLASR